MPERIRLALDRAGYTADAPTVENRRLCFGDYVDSGVWQGVSCDDEVTDEQMVAALLSLR